MRRSAPRPVGPAVSALADRLAPVSLLAAVQRVWGPVVGPAIAAEARPVSDRAGTITVACRSAVWAQELDLMSTALAARLNEVLEQPSVRGLRCVVAAPSRGAPGGRR